MEKINFQVEDSMVCGFRPDQLDKGGGHPRCLATLPSNIDDLINQFKAQECVLVEKI